MRMLFAAAALMLVPAALQADLEQAIKVAVDQAAATLRERLEAELPAILAQAMSRIRPG